MSWFTIRKIQSAEPVQAQIKLLNIPETKHKNARYIIVLIQRKTNNVSIGKKSILGYKPQKKHVAPI